MKSTAIFKTCVEKRGTFLNVFEKRLLENHAARPQFLLPPLKNLKHCHIDFWNYKDHQKNFSYQNRNGTWADFEFAG